MRQIVDTIASVYSGDGVFGFSRGALFGGGKGTAEGEVPSKVFLCFVIEYDVMMKKDWGWEGREGTGGETGEHGRRGGRERDRSPKKCRSVFASPPFRVRSWLLWAGRLSLSGTCETRAFELLIVVVVFDTVFYSFPPTPFRPPANGKSTHLLRVSLPTAGIGGSGSFSGHLTIDIQPTRNLSHDSTHTTRKVPHDLRIRAKFHKACWCCVSHFLPLQQSFRQ